LRFQKFPRIWFVGVLAAAAVTCAPGNDARKRVVPSYDLFSGRLVQLSADQDGDGALDQWTYLDGNRPLRGEADLDGDGRIDRWEYFDRSGALTHVGSSSRGDGVEDTWSWIAASNGESRVSRSRARDRRFDRQEFFAKDTLLRAEEDNNGDGRSDRWDRYDAGVLREAAYDTSGGGRPDVRLLYDDKGRYVGIESDPERDGTFVRLSGDAAAKVKAGVAK